MRQRRQVVLQLGPVGAAVGREEQANLRAGKQQVRVLDIFADGADDAARGHVARNGGKRPAAIGRLVDVVVQVVAAMVIDGYVNGVGVVARRFDAAKPRRLRQARQAILQVSPGLAVIVRHPQATVIRAHIEQALRQRRRRDRHQSRVERHAIIHREHVLIRQAAHQRQLAAIDAGCHISKIFPGGAAVTRAEQVLATCVDGGSVERRQRDGRVPVGVVPLVAEHLLWHSLAPGVPVAPVANRPLRIAGANVL